MPIDLSQQLVVGISSTALFDLAAADRVFHEEGIGAFREFMRGVETAPPAPGTGFALAKALLDLNTRTTTGQPVVEVIVMSRNSPDTARAVMNAVEHYGLAITRYAFTGGESLAPYARPLGVDLFLSTSHADVQAVIDARSCAAALLYPPPTENAPPDDQVRFAFDADAVLFSEASELTYKKQGLPAFHAAEAALREVPMDDGPFASLLRKLARVKRGFGVREEYAPIRIGIVTARNAPAAARVVTTLRAWDVYADEVFFLGGIEKRPVLERFRPHIFFDDQDVHVRPASTVVPAGLVPYPTASPLHVAGPAPASDEGSIPLTRSPADEPAKVA